MRDRRLNSQPSCNQRFRTNPLEQVRYGRQQDLGGTHQDVPFPHPSHRPWKSLRDFHIPTASTISSYEKARPNSRAHRINNFGWAKLNRRSGPSALAKRTWCTCCGSLWSFCFSRCACGMRGSRSAGKIGGSAMFDRRGSTSDRWDDGICCCATPKSRPDDY